MLASLWDWMPTLLTAYFVVSFVMYFVHYLDIEFAPFSIPWERRMQTLVVWSMSNQFLIMPLVCSSAFLYLLATKYYFVAIIYAFWMWYDRFTCEEGGRGSKKLMNAGFWKHYLNYFPIKLHKTAELDPNKKYIVGYHPHGVLPYAHACLRVKDSGYRDMFPGIDFKVTLLEIQFWVPFHREIVTALGFCSVDKASLDYLLTRESAGTAVVVMVGGASEALDAVPNTMKLTLKKRKGFVKTALRHGASLVPILSFGENDVYYQEELEDDSTAKKIAGYWGHRRGFVFPKIKGRGIFNYSIGYLPHRRSINVVVGKPIEVPKVEDPTSDKIDHYHALYIEEVKRLFEENKHKYLRDTTCKLDIK